MHARIHKAHAIEPYTSHISTECLKPTSGLVFVCFGEGGAGGRGCGGRLRGFQTDPAADLSQTKHLDPNPWGGLPIRVGRGQADDQTNN